MLELSGKLFALRANNITFLELPDWINDDEDEDVDDEEEVDRIRQRNLPSFKSMTKAVFLGIVDHVIDDFTIKAAAIELEEIIDWNRAPLCKDHE